MFNFRISDRRKVERSNYNNEYAVHTGLFALLNKCDNHIVIHDYYMTHQKLTN